MNVAYMSLLSAEYQLMRGRKLLMIAYELLMRALMFLKHG
jgi:hypothetical protein